jgi:hypothetical protein
VRPSPEQIPPCRGFRFWGEGEEGATPETEEVVAEPGAWGRWRPVSRIGLGVCGGDSSSTMVEEFRGDRRPTMGSW